MESTILSVAQGFNLKCTKSKVFKDKFGHVIATTQGSVRIQRVGSRRGQSQGYAARDNNIAAILFQHEVKEHLHNRGFAVDRFLISSDGMPFFKTDGVDGDAYTACYTQTGPNIDFTRGNGVLDVAVHIAKMHAALDDANIVATPTKKIGVGGDVAKLQETLASLKKKLLKTGRFSDFDMLFLRGYEMLAPHITTPDGRHDEKHICHNLLKEENIYKQSNRIAVTNFSETAQAHNLHDLAYIIKRYIKAKPQETIPISKILQAYAANCPKPLDEALLRRILLYPDKFIKVTIDYYSKKRSFAPNTYISRMQECLRVGTVLAESL